MSRESDAAEVAALGAPAPGITFGPGNMDTGAYDVDHGGFSPANKQLSSIVSSPGGRLLGTLFDYANPADEQRIVALEAGGYKLARWGFAGAEQTEIRPRIGIFRNLMLYRRNPRYTPPEAASEIGRAPMKGAGPPPVLGNRTIRWPLAPQIFGTFSGKDPQA